MATQQVQPEEITIEEKLKALYHLQTVATEIDKIKILRGELPLEVQDLQDEIAGYETRIENYKNEVVELEKLIANRKNLKGEAVVKIAKCEEQQNNVRNNREYDSLSKEIDYQKLEIELCDKKIAEHTAQIAAKKEEIENAKTYVEDRKIDLKQKKSELNEIIAETKQEEERLMQKGKECEEKIEERLLLAFKRIRKNLRNGLAVVPIQRDACGGCFNKIPPQRQLDIRLRKKIIVCEYCGRILVDPELAEAQVQKSEND
jgi:predicted  nucleic acid-binding Zn-ribbon protein